MTAQLLGGQRGRVEPRGPLWSWVVRTLCQPSPLRTPGDGGVGGRGRVGLRQNSRSQSHSADRWTEALSLGLSVAWRVSLKETGGGGWGGLTFHPEKRSVRTDLARSLRFTSASTPSHPPPPRSAPEAEPPQAWGSWLHPPALLGDERQCAPLKAWQALAGRCLLGFWQH